jgi:hypothetical protein
LQHLGREPSVTEMILVRRISALQWDLLRMDSVDLELLSGHAAAGEAGSKWAVPMTGRDRRPRATEEDQS